MLIKKMYFLLTFFDLNYKYIMNTMNPTSMFVNLDWDN